MKWKFSFTKYYNVFVSIYLYIIKLILYIRAFQIFHKRIKIHLLWLRSIILNSKFIFTSAENEHISNKTPREYYIVQIQVRTVFHSEKPKFCSLVCKKQHSQENRRVIESRNARYEWSFVWARFTGRWITSSSSSSKERPRVRWKLRVSFIRFGSKNRLISGISS